MKTTLTLRYQKGLKKIFYEASTDCTKLLEPQEKTRVQLLGAGSILREVEAAATILADDFDVLSDVFSVTSFNELARAGNDATRWNTLHPQATPKGNPVTKLLDDSPTIAATDYVRTYAEQIRQFIPGPYYVLGTDGFGRSDTREQLRIFFEVNRYYIAVMALRALADAELIPTETVNEAIIRFKINPDAPNPRLN